MTAVAAVETPVWRFYRVTVAAVTRLSPSFVRVTLTGPDLDEVADNGFDQRIKLVLPAPDGGFAHLAEGGGTAGWYADWRLLPAEQRPPIRTYTVRGVRPEAREVDIDMVRHGDSGPASRFASSARPGDGAMLMGPNGRYGGRHGGLEFRPPAGHVGPTLLVGDETAVPAVLAIIERLPEDAFGEVVLEVPDAGDISDAPAPPGLRLTWLVRRRGAGSALPEGVRAAVGRIGVEALAAPQAVPSDEAAEDAPLWDVPEDARPSGLYAWLAGESTVITGLRRYLVRERGVDRRGVAFMGYWKDGRPEC
jgi:NADPH-dependent ferric siderophore reductase